MYLNGLMQGEKYAFLSIVKHLVSVDGDFSDEEQILIDGFLGEMGFSEDPKSEIGYEDAIEMFTYSTLSVRKKVFIELVGVTLCDEMLHSNEKDFLDNVALKFHINEEDKSEMFCIVRQLTEIYRKMALLVE